MLYVVRAMRERAPFVAEILVQIPDAIVYWDDIYHNAMRSYLHVCEHIVGDQPAILMEDDIVLAQDFRRKVERVVRLYPEILISFFSLSAKTEPRFKKGREYCMSQCEYFPAGFACKVVRAYEHWPQKDVHPTAYDYLVGYAWGHNTPYLAWAPSLVQHRVCKSIIDLRRSSKRQSKTFVLGEVDSE